VDSIEAAARLAMDDQKDPALQNSFAGKQCGVRRG
jgi:hypothetical protein